MNETTTRMVMIAIALAQGLALYLLTSADTHDFWPSGVLVAEVPLWTLAITLPIGALLTLDGENWRRTLIGLGVFAPLAAAVGAYIGWQMEPDERVWSESVLFLYIASMGLFCFKAVMYLQTWANHEKLSYDLLFRLSWRNLLLVGVCGLFVLVFWLIILLWALLLDQVGVKFLLEWAQEPWFTIPILSLANGTAFIVFREHSNIIATVARILRTLCLFLLPLLVIIELSFLVVLVFVDINALWGTGFGTMLVIALQMLILFFFNATFQNEDDQGTYPLLVRRFILVGLAVLPLYAALAVWGIGLRVDQYGITVTRAWAMLVIGLLAVLTIAYSANLAAFRERAMNYFGWINVRFGLLVMALAFLVNSPVIDFRKVSVASQLARLESGETTLANFDVEHFARDLARPGYLAMQELAAERGGALAEEIERVYMAREERRNFVNRTVADKVQVIPDTLTPPESLISAIENLDFRGGEMEIYLLQRDMNGDGQDEWISVHRYRHYCCNADLWLGDGERWRAVPMLSDFPEGVIDLPSLLAELKTAPHPWQVLRSGDDIIMSVSNADAASDSELE